MRLPLPFVLLLGCAACAQATASVEAGETPQAARAAPVKLEFGVRGELIVDGRPRFIRAGYRSGQFDGFTAALPTAAEAGFDMVHDYRFEGFDLARDGVKGYIQDARAYLRAADRHGLGVFLGLPRQAVRAGDERAITRIVEALSGERALWMWYLYDEPRPEVLPVETAERMYGLLHRLDPARPVVILTNRIENTLLYRPYCDLMWFDRYPIAATALDRSSLKPIAEALQAMPREGTVRRHAWPVLQAQDNRGSPQLRRKRPNLRRPDDATHRPNEAELRAQAHIAIARNAMAVAYYWGPESWYSMKDDTPKTWAALGRVLRELGELEPVLLAERSHRLIQAEADRGDVLTWTREHDGRLWVGVVNTDIHRPARVMLRGIAAGDGLARVLGDGGIEATARGVGVRLAPAGVLVMATPPR